MRTGQFYFLKDEYFIDFPDKFLMTNKEKVNGIEHDRPCYYSFQEYNSPVYWMIPISSKVEKFKAIHARNVEKYGKSDTILFGQVLNKEKVFLLQNIFPVIPYYILKEYKFLDNIVNIDKTFEKELIEKAKKILNFVRRGKKLVFPDILKIEKELISMLSKGVK